MFYKTPNLQFAQMHYRLFLIFWKTQVHFGGKSMVFSADHMNDPVAINKLYEQEVVSSGRRDTLLNFPWNHDIILHEAGIPPIHTPMETLVALPEEVKGEYSKRKSEHREWSTVAIVISDFY